MCTIGGLGWHIGWQSTDISVNYWSAIDWLLVDSWPTVDRQSTDRSTDSRPMHHPICTHLLVDHRSTIDRLLVDSRLIVDRYIDRLSADASADMCTFIYLFFPFAPFFGVIIDRQSIQNSQSKARSIGPLSPDLSVDYQPIVGRLSIWRPRPPIVHMIL